MVQSWCAERVCASRYPVSDRFLYRVRRVPIERRFIRIKSLSMLTLYVKTGCPFCAVALKKVDDLGLSIEEKNIADPGVAEELEERGGKVQTPYLIDSEKGVALYESSAIADYLQKTYGKEDSLAPDLSKLTVHRSDDADVCEVCQ